MKLAPDENTRRWLLAFWEARDLVTEESQCPTPIIYEDGSEGRCVLSRAHLAGEVIEANVPHADKDGRLAPLLVSWETIREVREVSRMQDERRNETRPWT